MTPGQLLNRIILIGTIVLVGFTAWFFSDVVAYLLISAVMWFLLTPLVNFLDYTGYKGKSLPRWAATLMAMLIFLGSFVGIGSVFFPMVLEQANVLSSIDQEKLLQEIMVPLNRLNVFLVEHGVNDLESRVKGYVETINIIDFFGNSMSSIVGLAGNLLVGFFAVCFISFFFLKDESLVKRVILGATPDQYVERIGSVLSSAKRLLSRYFLGLIIQVSLIATLVTIGMSIVGVENAFLIGIFAGFINVIPYIGPIIGTAFGMFIVFTTQIEMGIDDGTGGLMIAALIVFLIVQTLDNLVFQPLIFANSVSAHPLEIFLVIFVAGKLGGIVGMISAIPSYTLIRIVAKEFLTKFKVVQNLTKNI